MPRNIFSRREKSPDPREEARRVLRTMPFLSPDEIQRDFTDLGVVDRRVSVPLDRIISADFEDWSTGDAVKQTQDGEVTSSIDHVLSLAANQAWMSYDPEQHNIVLAPFADQAGNVWYGVEEGKHRIAAAKLALGAAADIVVDMHLPSAGNAISQYPGILMLEENIARPASA